MVNGCEDVLDDTFWPKIKKGGGEIASQSSKKLIRELVAMVLWAAHHKTFGKYIGANCMSTLISRKENFITQ